MMTRAALLVAAMLSIAACSYEAPKNEVTLTADPALPLPVSDGSKSVDVTIYRDRYGVPQVFADSNYGVYFGYGYAVARDRLFQMEMLKRTAQGRVAQVLGRDYLDLDIKLRTQYDHQLVHQQVSNLGRRDLDILEGYAAGFNAYIDELRSTDAFETGLPKPFYDFDFLPSRWNAFDVASVYVGSIAHRYADFNSERDNLNFLQAMQARHGQDAAWDLFNGVKWLKDQTSPTTIARGQDIDIATLERPAYLDRETSAAPVARIVFDAAGGFAGLTTNQQAMQAYRQQLATRGFESHPEFSPASNYWALSHVSDAAGALVNGPQFAFAVPSYVYAIGLHGGDFDVVGNTLLALPSLLFAHNNHIAWGSTAGISDQTDEFWLELNPDNPEQYRHNGKWQDFESHEEVVAVRDGDPITVIARRAAQGMVQAYQPEESIAWVRARAWEGMAVQDMLAWVWLATDKTLEEAQERLAQKSTNINMYTMDKTGRLGYVHSGKYPLRALGHDSRLPAPGDGRYDWQGLRPYSDNPKVIDPPKGYIVNWNNRPRADWISSDLWPYTWARADRAHILIDEVRAAQNRSVADIVAINTRSSFEDVNYRYLMPLLEGAVTRAAVLPQTQEALALLKRWDHRWVADEQAQFGPANALMESFLRHLNINVFLDDVGEEAFSLLAATNYPNNVLGASLGTPVAVRAFIKYVDDLQTSQGPAYDFLNGESVDVVVLESFLNAIEELGMRQSTQMSRWRLAAAPMVWRPYNFRGVPQASAENSVSSVTYQNRGTENNVFVATGSGITARDVNPPGQGGHLRADGSPASHYDDQLDLYNRFEYKDLPFERAAVKAAAVEVVELRVGVPD